MTDRKTVTRARLAFVGAGVEGSIDAAAFGEALVGLDEACRSANRRLNEDRASVSVRLRADMTAGSVVWTPEVWMTLASQASLTPIVSVVTLLGILGLAGKRALKAGHSVLALIRDFKDTVVQEPDAEAEISEKGVTLRIKGKLTKVDAAVWRCSREVGVRQGLARVVGPLRLPGVDGMEVRSLSARAKKPLAVFTKSDVPLDEAFQELPPPASAEVIDGERDAILRVVRPALEGTYDWTFSEDGKQTFGAPMKDEDFLERRDRGVLSALSTAPLS